SDPLELPPRALPGRKDPVVAALLGWFVPGLGHVYAGRPLKGLLYLVLVGAVFGAGLLYSRGLCVSPEREPIWFVRHALAGAPAPARPGTDGGAGPVTSANARVTPDPTR